MFRTRGDTLTKPALTRRARGRPARNETTGAQVLLTSARQAFACHGFEGASLRAIGKASGVDPALVSHHFGSKEALWVAVVEHIASLAAPMIDMTGKLRLESALGPRDRVVRALELLIDMMIETPDVGMFFSTTATEVGSRLDLLVDRLVRPYHDVFVPLLEDAIDSGDIPEQEPEILFAMMANGISKTVAYSHVLSSFTSLVHKPDGFRAAVLRTATVMLGIPSQTHQARASTSKKAKAKR